MRQRQAMCGGLLVMLFSQTIIAEEQCVKLSQIPATYRAVLVFQPENLHERLEIIPSTFRTMTEKILVTQAHCPGDQLVSETKLIEVKSAFTDLQVIPAVYETVYVKKQVWPPTEGWHLIGYNRIGYEKQPERLEIAEIHQIKRPEQIREISIAATIKTITISRIRQPGHQCAYSVRIPARFRTIERQLLEKPAEVRRTNIPAQFKAITKQQINKSSDIKSTPVACDTLGALPKIAALLPDKPTRNSQFDFHYGQGSKGREPTNKEVWVPFNGPEVALSMAPGSIQRTLPWPPPRGSWLFPIPNSPFEDASVMTDVETILAPALREAGYTNQRYYRIDNPDGSLNGFAIVTQLEKWVSNGIPDEKKRFVRTGKEEFSLIGYIRDLFFAPEGRYRLILMLITDKTWSWNDEPEKQMTENMTNKWLFGGTNNLSEEFQKVEFTPRHKVEVVIYEFKREGETVKLELPGGLTAAENHFRYSGIQSTLGLDKK